MLADSCSVNASSRADSKLLMGNGVGSSWAGNSQFLHATESAPLGD